MTKTSLESKY